MQISRVKRPKSIAKKSYDRLSHIYDWLAGSSETQFMHLGLEMLTINSRESILEMGPGTGKGLVEICHKVGESGKVYGLDLSRGMLQVAQDRLMKAGYEGRVRLLIGDGSLLPYADHAFSALFLCFTLELFDTPEIPQVLEECKRVLQPGGRLGVVCMLKTEQPGKIVRLYEWFHEKIPSYVDCRPINAREIIEKAGFSIQQHQLKSMWGLPVELVVASNV